MNYVDEQAREPAGLRLAYITPAFPWVSHVFEQNEMTGLLAAGCDVVVLSCVRPGADEPVHAFARSLLERAHYASAGSIATGLAWCLTTRPLATLRTAATAVWAALTDRARFRPHLGVWALAIRFAPVIHQHRTQWLHADFAQGSATVAWYLRQLLDLPFSYKAHAYDIYSTQPGDREAPAFFDRKTRAARLIFCVSEYGRDRLQQETGARIADKVHIHRVGVQLADFAPLPDPPADAAPPKVVALGRLIEKKGFDRLIAAIAALRDRGVTLSCSIHGDGPLEAELRDLIHKLRLDEHVTLAGAYEHAELPRILAPALALVVPSVVARSGDMDGVPTVIYEAMALGRPVIASALSGIPEVITHERTGWLVPPGDVAALAGALEQVLQERATAAEIAAHARQYVTTTHDAGQLSRALCRHFQQQLSDGRACQAVSLPS